MITLFRQRSAPRRWLLRLAGAAVLACLGWLAFSLGRYYRAARFSGPQPIHGPQLDIHVLNVGDGTSELLATPGGHFILIDAGTRDNPAVEAASIVGPKNAIDLVILTSTHPSAIGGFRAVADAVKIDGPVLLPGDAQAFRRAGRSARDVIDTLQAHNLAGIAYDQYMIAHPNPIPREPAIQLAGLPVISPYYHTPAMAVRIEFGASALLYAAGIDVAGERDILSRNSNLACDVLSIPSSSIAGAASPEILAEAGPQVIAISCDHDHEPDPETQRWIEASGARVGRTDLLGSFTLHLDSQADQSVAWTYRPPAAQTAASP